MLWFDVLAIATPAMVLVMSAAYYAGRRRERRELWPEAAAAARYKMACRDVLTWCCQDEFRSARLVAGHIMDHGEGVGPINAGTPHGDETCTVNGLREQLRRVNSETANAGGNRAEPEGVTMNPTAAGEAPVDCPVGRPEPERRECDAPVCPWCDRQGWDTCGSYYDTYTCEARL